MKKSSRKIKLPLIENKDCADIVINPTDTVHTDKPYGLLPNAKLRAEMIENSTKTIRFKAREKRKKNN